MRFEESIEIEAGQERVWEVVSDIESWPRRIETVDTVEPLTSGQIAVGSRFRLKQPKLPEGIWEVTAWDPPTYFEWRQRSGGVTNTAGHRIEAIEGSRSRLTLTIDMRGFLVPIMGPFMKGLVTRYLALEAHGMKRAAESSG